MRLPLDVFPAGCTVSSATCVSQASRSNQSVFRDGSALVRLLRDVLDRYLHAIQVRCLLDLSDNQILSCAEVMFEQEKHFVLELRSGEALSN